MTTFFTPRDVMAAFIVGGVWLLFEKMSMIRNVMGGSSKWMGAVVGCRRGRFLKIAGREVA